MPGFLYFTPSEEAMSQEGGLKGWAVDKNGLSGGHRRPRPGLSGCE